MSYARYQHFARGWRLWATMIAASVLAASDAHAVRATRIDGPEAVEVSRQPYREFAENSCSSDECGLEFKPVRKNRRFDVRHINCRIAGDSDFTINSAIMQIRTDEGAVGGPLALMITLPPFVRQSLVAVDQQLDLPLRAGEHLILDIDDDSSRNWKISCAISGDLVRVRS